MFFIPIIHQYTPQPHLRIGYKHQNHLHNRNTGLRRYSDYLWVWNRNEVVFPDWVRIAEDLWAVPDHILVRFGIWRPWDLCLLARVLMDVCNWKAFKIRTATKQSLLCATAFWIKIWFERKVIFYPDFVMLPLSSRILRLSILVTEALNPKI